MRKSRYEVRADDFSLNSAFLIQCITFKYRTFVLVCCVFDIFRMTLNELKENEGQNHSCAS